MKLKWPVGIATFLLENPKVKERATPYVFLEPSGAFVAANFTGK